MPVSKPVSLGDITGNAGLLRELLSDAIPSRWIQKRKLVLDAWQEQVADATDPLTLMLCSRQSGKTTLVSALVAYTLEMYAHSLVLVLAPTERQSQELLLKSRRLLSLKYSGFVSIAKKTLELRNGSRAFALPGTEETIRGFSAPDLVVIDEAAMTSDELYYAIRPMLATCSDKSRIILLTTPKGKRGFFYQEWISDRPAKRIKVTAYDCPRISQSFLESERKRMPEWLFRQEYLCEFVDNELQVFNSDLIERSFADGEAIDPLPITTSLEIPTNGQGALAL